jgi:hypothetical protein
MGLLGCLAVGVPVSMAFPPILGVVSTLSVLCFIYGWVRRGIPAGLALYAIGTVALFVAQTILDAPPDSRYFEVAYLVPVVFGIVSLARRLRCSGVPPTVLAVDSVICLAGSYLLIWAFVLIPAIRRHHDPVWEVFEVGYMALAATFIMLIQVAYRFGVVLSRVLIVAVICGFVGDVVWAMGLASEGGSNWDLVADAFYATAYIAGAWGVVHYKSASRAAHYELRLKQSVVISAAALVIGGVSIVFATAAGEGAVSVGVAMSVLIGAAIARIVTSARNELAIYEQAVYTSQMDRTTGVYSRQALLDMVDEVAASGVPAVVSKIRTTSQRVLSHLGSEFAERALVSTAAELARLPHLAIGCVGPHQLMVIGVPGDHGVLIVDEVTRVVKELRIPHDAVEMSPDGAIASAVIRSGSTAARIEDRLDSALAAASVSST